MAVCMNQSGALLIIISQSIQYRVAGLNQYTSPIYIVRKAFGYSIAQTYVYANQHVPSSMVLLAGKRISKTQVYVPMFQLYTLLSTVVIAICILLADKTK